MTPPEDGTPIIIKKDDQFVIQPRIVVEMAAPVVNLTVDSIPVTTNVQVHLQAWRRDILLAIIALALIVGLFV